MIRKAKRDDIPAVSLIYEHILDRQELSGKSSGWIRGVYPTENTALDALNRGDLFVMTDDSGIISAAAIINQIQVPVYSDASWLYPDAPDNRIMVLHTLVVEPNASGKGCGKRFVKFYEDYAAEHGCPYLRMDTNVINSDARALYTKLGYRESDIVPCEFNGIPNVKLVCLEKYLGE